jgi:Fur family ferric uptake transcriptional regulator
MNNGNNVEKANLRSLLTQEGGEPAQDTLNVIDAFLDTEEHVTLDELWQILRQRGYDYDYDFVRQAMERMVALGFARRSQFENQPVRYEHRHLGRHHDHLICTKCGKITEFANEDLERMQIGIAAEHGFHMLQHKMEIYGICSDCLNKRQALMPLSLAREGETVLIRDVAGGVVARSRLAAMGLRAGDRIEIINNNGHGRLILGHDCTRLAVGRGVAQKILVSLVEPGEQVVCEER